MLLGGTGPTANAAAQRDSFASASSLGAVAMEPGTVSPPPPGPDLAVVNWTSNHLPNAGFESWTSDNPIWPKDWGAYAQGDTYEWLASASNGQVHEGNHSGGILCASPYQHASYAYLQLYSIGANMGKLSVTFDWYVDQNEDPTPNHDSVWLQLQLRNSSTDTLYQLYYYLNGTDTGNSNNTGYGFYTVGGSAHQWHTFNRNITADFVAIPQFPKTARYMQVSAFLFRAQTRGSTIQSVRAFIDDVHLQNDTTTWVGDSLRNGNFETGSLWPWDSAGNYDASDARRSPMAHSGSWSLNMTALSHGNTSLAYTYGYPYTRITELNPGWLNFWWRLTYDNLRIGSSSYLYVVCYNDTASWYLVYSLGYCGSTAPYSNSSNYLSLRADGFNTTGSWVYFNRNIWTDSAAYFHPDDAHIYMVYFWTTASTAGSRVVTLVDDTGLISAAIADGGYEDQPGAGSRISSWDYEDSHFTVTDTLVYAGSKAANATVDGQSFGIGQSLQMRPLNGTRETYLDVMWRLRDYTPGTSNYAYISLSLGDGHALFYFFAASTVVSPPNSTWEGWFNVTGINTIGTWTQMHRDLVHDYQAVFGSLPTVDSSIAYLGLSANMASGRLELLLDDFYLYDDPAPQLSNIQRSATVVDHNQAVQVSATVIDQDRDVALVHYRANGSGWQTVTMTHTAGNTFAGTVPGQAYSTSVEYYVTANDTWGMTTTILDGGAYWSYTVTDLSSPTVGITAPSGGTVVSGTININATAADAQSGIATVEFLVDGTSVFNDTTPPYTYSWNTVALADGPHTVTVRAFNGAGNSATASVSLTVSNPTTTTTTTTTTGPAIPGFPWAAILLAGVAAIGLSVLRRRRSH